MGKPICSFNTTAACPTAAGQGSLHTPSITTRTCCQAGATGFRHTPCRIQAHVHGTTGNDAFINHPDWLSGICMGRSRHSCCWHNCSPIVDMHAAVTQPGWQTFTVCMWQGALRPQDIPLAWGCMMHPTQHSCQVAHRYCTTSGLKQLSLITQYATATLQLRGTPGVAPHCWEATVVISYQPNL